jgi:hypothetical protein
MAGHLAKPIDRHDLIETIIRHARSPLTAGAGTAPAMPGVSA